MSNMHDYRSEIDQWTEMWDEMEKSNIHPSMQKPKPSPFAADVLGTTAQDTYYDYFDAQDDYQPDPSEYDPESEALLQEDKSPNPIYPDSQGVDQDQPTPVWVNDKLLDEITSLKNRLFKLENAVAKMDQGKGWSQAPVRENKKWFNEVQQLRTRLDKVSSQLGIADEPSPWQIKLESPKRNLDRKSFKGETKNAVFNKKKLKRD